MIGWKQKREWKKAEAKVKAEAKAKAKEEKKLMTTFEHPTSNLRQS